MPLLETAIAFVAVMLAASLFVSALVQVAQNALHYRGRTLVDMLKTLMHGFLVFHDDEDALAADGAEARSDPARAKAHRDRLQIFVNDVLGDPALHAREVKLSYQDDPEKLAELVEYIHPDDLIALAHNYSESFPPGKHPASDAPAISDAPAPTTLDAVAAAPMLKLPDTWVGAGTDAKPKTYANTQEFARYVKRAFPTIEATHAQQFKRKIRRLTVALSCTVVVLFCLDGLQLIRALYHSRTGADALARQTDALQAVASRLGVGGAPAGTERDTSNKDLLLELQKTASILDEANVGLGWQNSWITREWCAYRGACEEPPPTARHLALDALLWLVGLLFSCVMLSLGAPFWVTTMSSLIRMQNEVQQRRQIPPTPGIGGASTP